MRARLVASALLALAAGATFGQVKVEQAWVRGTVPGQVGTGAFFDITSTKAATLVAAESPVAGVTQIHAMEMKNNVMTMKEIEGIALPAGKAVRLSPGGNHVMLLDLKSPMKAGESVPIKLTVEYADKKRETVEVKAEVRALTAAAPATQHKH